MPTMIITGILGIGLLAFGAVSCIESGANARYEANSQYKANKIKDADIELRDELLAEKTEEYQEDLETALAEKEAIEAARDRETERADAAEQLAAEREDLECPVVKPDKFCRWDCTRPLLD